MKTNQRRKVLGVLLALLLIVTPIIGYANLLDRSSVLPRVLGDSGSIDLGSSEREEELDQSPNIGVLGTSGPFEVHLPDRKIPKGDGFDLLTGITVTGAEAETAEVVVTDDGGFDDETEGTYTVVYQATVGDTVYQDLSRQITVTSYQVGSTDFVFTQMDEEKEQAYLEEAKEEGSSYHDEETIHTTLTSHLSVKSEEGEYLSHYLKVVDSGGMDFFTQGDYDIEFALVQDGETKVEIYRKAVVQSPAPRMATFAGIMPFSTSLNTPNGRPYIENASQQLRVVAQHGGTANGDYGVFDMSLGSTTRQYYAGYNIGTIFYVTREGVTTAYYTRYLPTKLNLNKVALSTSGVVSQEEPNGPIIATWDFSGANDTPDYGLILSQKLSMNQNSRTLDMEFFVENTDPNTPIEVRMFHGGDTYFAGDDSGYAYYNGLGDFVYIRKSSTTGMMAFKGVPPTPHDQYFGGYYWDGKDTLIANNSDLGNFIYSNYRDQGYYLQWNFDVPPEERHSIYADQQWTLPGRIQVFAGFNQTTPPNVTVPVTFTLQNMETTAETATLSVSNVQEWATQIDRDQTQVTLPPASNQTMLVYVTVPADAVNGMQDQITLSATDGYGKMTKAVVTLTIDESMEAIQDIRILDQTNTTLKAAVDFQNVSGERETYVQILNTDGTPTGLEQTRVIPSGGEFDFSISGLTMNQQYIIRAKVEGIPYYSQRVFYVEKMPEGLELDILEDIILKSGSYKEVIATLAPADVGTKTLNWSEENPTGIISLSATTNSGEGNQITGQSDGITTVKVSSKSLPSLSKTFQVSVDGTPPELGRIGLMRPYSIITNQPVSVFLNAEDPVVNGYASGVKEIYYRKGTTTPPSFNISDTTGWTLYNSSGPNTVTGTNNEEFVVWAVAVDNVGNVSNLVSSEDRVVIDTTPPVLTLPDIHVVEGSETISFPSASASAEDGIDGSISLNSSNVSPQTINPTSKGLKNVTYTVSDTAENETVKDQNVYIHGKINVQVDSQTIYVRESDTQADFSLIQSSQINPRASVILVEADGRDQQPAINPPTTSHDGSTIPWGQAGASQTLEYKASHTYPGTIGNKTESAFVTVEVVADDVTIPGNPEITLGAEGNKLYSFQELQELTDGAILGNATSSAPISYTIKDLNGNPKTLSEVNSTVGHYKLTYKASGADGRNTYKTVDVEVYGKLVLSGREEIHLAESQSIVPEEKLREVKATYQAFDPVSGQIVTKEDGRVTAPTGVALSPVGVTELNYVGQYPVSLNETLSVSGNRLLVVQGVPKIVANDIIIGEQDQDADLDVATDARIGLKATVEVVSTSNRTPVTKDITTSVIISGESGIEFGERGDYPLTYTVKYTHPNIPELTTTANSVVTITDADPNGPDITVDLTNSTHWHYMGTTTPMTLAQLKGKVSAVEKDTTTAVPFVLLYGDTELTALTAEVLSGMLGEPGSYKITVKATDALGRNSYSILNIYTVGAMTVTPPTPLNRYYQATGGVISDADFTGANGYAASFMNHERTIINADIQVDPTGVAKDQAKTVLVTSTIRYPASYPGATYEANPTRDLRIHGVPVITAADTITLHVNDEAADFDLLDDSRIGLGATVEYITENNVKTDHEFNPGTDLTVSSENIGWGTAGSYTVTYHAAYAAPGGQLLETTKDMTVVITEAGDPDGPQFTFAVSGEEEILYFQTHTPNFTEDTVKSYFAITDKDGTPITPTSLTFTIDGTTDWKDALNTIGIYNVRFKVVDSSNRTNYFNVPLYVHGALRFTDLPAVDAFQETNGVLNTAQYTGSKDLQVKFTHASGQNKTAVITKRVDKNSGLEDVSLDTMGFTGIRYTIAYPSEVLDSHNQGYTQEAVRPVRVHGRPVFSMDTPDLHLRVSDGRSGRATVSETHNDMLEGITATVTLLPLEEGGASSEKVATLSLAVPPDTSRISQFPLEVDASYTLPAGYDTSVSVTDRNNDRTVTLHGNIQTTGNGLTLSDAFLAGDYDGIAFPQMNVTAEVSYYDPQNPTTPLTVSIPVPANSYTGTIGFGIKGSYPITYPVTDIGVTDKPAALATQEKNIPVTVKISDSVIGYAPVIQGVKDIDWVEGVPASAGDLMDGIGASDQDQADITRDSVVVTIEKPDGSTLAVASTDTQILLPRGTNTVTYMVQDKVGNKTVETAELYVHGTIEIVANSHTATNIRESTSQSYRPNIDSLKVTYYDGKLERDVTFTIQDFPNKFVYDATNYDISTSKEIPFEVTVWHPVFQGDFTAPVSGGTESLSVLHNALLRVYGPIVIAGEDAYDSTGDTNTGGLPLTTYFVEKNTIQKDDFLTGVSASHRVPSGNSSTVESLTPSLEVIAPKYDMSKPNTFKLTYRVKDAVVPGGKDKTEDILVQVDGIPEIHAEHTPIYVEPGESLQDVLDYAEVTATVRFGNQPDQEVTFIPQLTELHDGNDAAQAVVGPIGSEQYLYVEAYQPDYQPNLVDSEDDFQILAYRRPVIEISGDDVVLFTGEGSTENIIAGAPGTVTYTPPNGTEVVVEKAILDTSAVNLDHGGHYTPKYSFEDPFTHETVTSREVAHVFVLNRAYIQFNDLTTVDRPDYTNRPASQLKQLIQAVGIGESVDHKTKTIRLETFEVDYDFSKVNFIRPRGSSRYPISLSGEFWYLNQPVSAKLGVTFAGGSDEGSNKPDGGLSTGDTGTGGMGGGNISRGTVEDLRSGEATHFADRTEEILGTMESGFTTEEVAFWRATSKLVERVGQEKTAQMWKITASDFKNPTQEGNKRRNVQAVPETYLTMPRYVLETLLLQEDTRLELDLGEYRWYLSSNTYLVDSNRTSYPLGVTGASNKNVQRIIGEFPSQQLHFGFDGGWDTQASLGVYITNEELRSQTLYMYYYNSYTGELEFVDAMEDLGNNWQSAVVRGVEGDYVITTLFLEDSRLQIDENPTTGGQTFLLHYARELVDNGTLKQPAADRIGRHPGKGSAEWATAVGAGSLLLLVAAAGMYEAQRRKRKSEADTPAEESKA